MPEETSTILNLDPNLEQRIRALAELQHRTPHGLMREAIVEYVERAERRAGFLAEAKQAFDDFQVTRAGVPLDDVQRWLSSWGADDGDQAPPACRKL